MNDKKESVQDDFTIIVQESIIKEAMILKYLTKDNKSTGGYITRFIEFFETRTDFYLVTEYVGDLNLAQFVEQAMKYIKCGKLKLSEYKRVIKFLFWQMCNTINWMHQDMSCCHLDLSMKNIIVRDGTFQRNVYDDTVTINPQIAVKFADFGLAEVFHPNNKSNYKMDKWGLKDSFETTAPKVYNEQIYDEMKSDIWSLGVIFYIMSCGESLYTIPEQHDAGYYCVAHSKLAMHIDVNQLSKYFNNKSVLLLTNMLNMNEHKRFSAAQVLQCKWFSAYYSRYSSRIKSK